MKLQIQEAHKYKTDKLITRHNMSQVLVAHAYNPSYSGGRNQEDHVFKTSLGKEFREPI
jgi:hypothetical protein